MADIEATPGRIYYPTSIRLSAGDMEAIRCIQHHLRVTQPDRGEPNVSDAIRWALWDAATVIRIAALTERKDHEQESGQD